NDSSNSSNVRVSQSGRLYRTTSASKYKLLIENEEEKGYDYNKILNLNVSSWYDKATAENYADLLRTQESPEGEEFEKIQRHFGLIAEHLVREGLNEFVDYDCKTGKVEGIHYDK